MSHLKLIVVDVFIYLFCWINIFGLTYIFVVSSKCYYWMICVGYMRCDKLFYYEIMVETVCVSDNHLVRNGLWIT